MRLWMKMRIAMRMGSLQRRFEEAGETRGVSDGLRSESVGIYTSLYITSPT